MGSSRIGGQTSAATPESAAPEWRECPFDARLNRTPYLVIPKLALQSMPMDWRERLEALLAEADATGLETPHYHVIRDDPKMTLVERSDSEDDYSPLESVHIVRRDPWADYRHGDITALCPEFHLGPQAASDKSREEK